MKHDLVRSAVRGALAECIEVGGYSDFALRSEVQSAVLRHMGIDPRSASRYGYIMRVIADEMLSQYSQTVMHTRMHGERRVRGYMGIKLTAQVFNLAKEF